MRYHSSPIDFEMFVLDCSHRSHNLLGFTVPLSRGSESSQHSVYQLLFDWPLGVPTYMALTENCSIPSNASDGVLNSKLNTMGYSLNFSGTFFNCNIVTSHFGFRNVFSALPAATLTPITDEEFREILTTGAQLPRWSVFLPLALSSFWFVLFRRHRWTDSIRLISGLLSPVAFQARRKTTVYLSLLCLWLFIGKVSVLDYYGDLISGNGSTNNSTMGKKCSAGCSAFLFYKHALGELQSDQGETRCLDLCLIDEPYLAGAVQAQIPDVLLIEGSSNMKLSLECGYISQSESPPIPTTSHASLRALRILSEHHIFLSAYRRESSKAWRTRPVIYGAETPFLGKVNSLSGALLNLDSKNRHLLTIALNHNSAVSLKTSESMFRVNVFGWFLSVSAFLVELLWTYSYPRFWRVGLGRAFSVSGDG